MRGDHFFDLARPDLISTRLDQVLLAIDNEQVSIGIEVAEIAGVEGPLTVINDPQDLVRLVRTLPITLHELRRAEDDLPDFTRGYGPRAVFGIDDANVHVRQRHSH